MKKSLTTRENWSSTSIIYVVFYTISLTWEIPSACFLKIKFSGSVIDAGNHSGVGFVIRSHNHSLAITTDLQAASEDHNYVVIIFRTMHILSEMGLENSNKL